MEKKELIIQMLNEANLPIDNYDGMEKAFDFITSYIIDEERAPQIASLEYIKRIVIDKISQIESKRDYNLSVFAQRRPVNESVPRFIHTPDSTILQEEILDRWNIKREGEAHLELEIEIA